MSYYVSKSRQTNNIISLSILKRHLLVQFPSRGACTRLDKRGLGTLKLPPAVQDITTRYSSFSPPSTTTFSRACPPTSVMAKPSHIERTAHEPRRQVR
jgi:hypothetical protein